MCDSAEIDGAVHGIDPAVVLGFLEGQLKARKLYANFNEEVTLRDVVLSSSAIPTVLPLHSFKYSGKFGRFADGSIVANNPGKENDEPEQYT
ncbi:hypothetical protein GH714_022460 [Hevea brasiliensis]|uniref:Patatin n=1 Tax=Hevea brasiliensis TaxID=3981 RepID=A0A6A6NIL4_HEVBR|nr:hypothetical protein GH714_022460 [Hevea brasiliensis]